ncbi:MAG: polysaccharide pyruvyl transferase family protein [Spirochaetes bacterium]|nr:polysaccharide pyruvyl transferase family protein [Spirochaetota bacterium]
MKKKVLSDGPRVLMVGYNGANNTGAEALLQADIEDVRAVLGPQARITVPTMNEANLRRYLTESPTLRISPMPTLYFSAIRRMVKENDLVLLAEGSTYMDTWGSPLLWAFLWATRCAAAMNKASLAYAVDAGALSAANQKRVRRIASRTDLIVTRTQAAAQRLRGLGVTAPIQWTADNAFTFRPRVEDEGWPVRSWPRAGAGMVGLAVVDFSLWPVVMRPWGRKDSCYKWPYYFSRSPQRLRFSEEMARGYAAQADRIVERTGKAIALICMEQVDEAMAQRVLRLMKRADAARIFSAREHNASQMTVLLRGLELLVTSRFHAAVLSLAAGVPQIAVGHDSRLRTLYGDLGLLKEWFLDPRPAEGNQTGRPGGELFTDLADRVERLLSNPGLQEAQLRRGHAEHLCRARRNRELLAAFVSWRLAGGTEAAQGGAEWVA